MSVVLLAGLAGVFVAGALSGAVVTVVRWYANRCEKQQTEAGQ